MGSLKLVILDLDGTLVDSMGEFETLAVELFVEAHDLDEAEARRMYRRTIGAPFAKQVEELFPRHTDNKRIIREFEQAKPRTYQRVKLHEGVLEALHLLRENKVLVGVCSSTTETMVDDVMRANPEMAAFISKTTGSLGEDDKEYQLTEIVTELKADLEDTTFIGDAPRDSWYARYRGLTFIGVEHTVGKEAFRREGAVSSPTILEAVKEVLGV